MTPGEAVRDRRAELGISRAELARRADVDPKTVQSLEQDARWPLDVNRARIESALGWVPGSLEKVRAGGEASVLLPSDVMSADERAKRHATIVPVDLAVGDQPESLELSAVRSSLRVLDTLPVPVQSVVLSQARKLLPTAIEALDEQHDRELIIRAFELLDEQEGGEQPGFHVWDAKYGPGPTPDSNTSDANVSPAWEDLPRVANTRGREPEEGDDDYGSGA